MPTGRASSQIAKEMGELAKLARDGKLKPDQMQGGTFTISSLGGIGGIYFTPIINAPEVAIMGVCRSFWKQVSTDGKTSAWRYVLPLSLSWDHRVIDGASAARFNSPLRQRCSPTCGACCSNVFPRKHAMAIVEVKVPDIGDFKDVPVIEVLVKPGDTVKPEDPLVTLESDKATMDVPSPAAGTVKAIAVKVGDKVSKGSALLTLERGALARQRRRRRRQGRRTAPRRQPKPSRIDRGARRQARGACSKRLRRRSLRAAAYGGTRRRRMRDARARRRTRRLFRRVSRRRPRHEDRAGRALRDARRRVPQRRLHSVEGAAAYGGA